MYTYIQNKYTNSEYSKMLILPLKILTSNRKKKTKSIAMYDFITLYTTLAHDKLIKRLHNVIDFAFEG